MGKTNKMTRTGGLIPCPQRLPACPAAPVLFSKGVRRDDREKC
jgi:hypothetical protein